VSSMGGCDRRALLMVGPSPLLMPCLRRAMHDALSLEYCNSIKAVQYIGPKTLAIY